MIKIKLENVRTLRFNTKEGRNHFIIAQSHASKTAEDIGNKVGLSKRQVKRIRKRYRNQGRLSMKKGSGRPHIMTKSHKLRLRNAINRSPCTPLATIVDSLDLPCSVVTAPNYLKSVGYSYKKTRPKPYLSYKNVQDRVAFAENYAEYDFSDAVFVDETVFQVGQPGYG